MTQPHPPRLPLKLLRAWCAGELLEDLEGHLFELFHRHARAQGLWYARLWFTYAVVRFLRPYTRRHHPSPYARVPKMSKNYFLTALRFLRRQRGYAFLNIAGLAVGLACCFFILMWVQDEYQIDRFHEQGADLYRVLRHVEYSGSIATISSLPGPLAEPLEADFPLVEDAIRISWGQRGLFTHQGQTHRASGLFADETFFEVFSFPLLQGSPDAVLDTPEGLTLSASLAQRLFGDDWQTEALGQIVRYDDDRDFTVTGIFADVPERSSLSFDYILPMADFVQQNSWLTGWSNGIRIYVKLEPGTDPAVVREQIRDVVMEKSSTSTPTLLDVQRYGDAYLYSGYEHGQVTGGRIEQVRIFSIVALLILVIACINFMNLATARSVQRAKEIGVRKSVGASRGSLIFQFLSESVAMTLAAFVLAVGLVAAGMTPFNDLTGKAMSLGSLSAEMWLLFLGLALLTGLLAGSYPAFYLSSFDVVRVLKSRAQHSRGSVLMRKGLVVLQFGLSVVFIIGTLVVYQQLRYISEKDLGVDRESLIRLTAEGNIADQFDTFKQNLQGQPGIAGVTRSSQNAISIGSSTTGIQWPGKEQDDQTLFAVLYVGPDFTETLGIEMEAGRDFSEGYSSEAPGFLVNEQAAAAMGLDDPLGTPLQMGSQEGPIIGVVKDFHVGSLHREILPLVVSYASNWGDNVYVRTRPGQNQEALASLEAVYQQHNPGFPFSYTFVEDEHQRRYRSEQVVGDLARYFAGLAVFVACLGLFGLASFTAEQRTKEMGVRKVLGASVSGLMVLLSRDFLQLVLLAFLVAAPVAYYLMNNWLADFAYRTEIGLGLFLAVGLGVLLIAGLTVSYQAFRTARTNPVRALRYE